MCRRILFAVALALPVLVRAQTPARFPPSAELTVALRSLVDANLTPGIVLGVLDGDGTTRVVSYGSGGADAKPLEARTVFEIGSINKTFTGTLLADMVAKGEVALNDTIAKYLPAGVRAPSRNGRAITLLDLATHRSGLPRVSDNRTPGDRTDPNAGYPVEKMYEALSSHQLRRDPGAEAEYSNFGFGLLGHLLARAAKTTYADLAKTRILDPLGMKATGFALEGAIEEWSAKGHRQGGPAQYWHATEAVQGAGGLRANITDMLLYLRAQVGPPRTDLERAMRAAHAVRIPLSPTAMIGLAWITVKDQDRTIVHHSGATGGFSSHIGFDPDRRVGFVMLTNTVPLGRNIGMELLRRVR